MLADSIRNNLISGILVPETNEHIKVVASSYIFALFPIITFNTINSVAFVNKGIYVLTLIYINNKIKINDTLKLFILFSPSILIYSSLSLRDTLILSLMILVFYLIINEKKFLIGLITLILLCIIKPQNGAICAASIASYFIFIKIFKKNISLTLSILFIFIFLILISFGEYIFDKLNFYRKGMYLEEYSQYRDLLSFTYYDNFLSLGIDFYSFKIFIISFFNFILAPTFSTENLFHFISSMESFFIIFFSFIFFINQYLIDKKLTIFWILLLLLFTALYSLLPFNDNTIVRYKFPVIIFILMSSYLTTKKN